jgi:hypothetical protein
MSGDKEFVIKDHPGSGGGTAYCKCETLKGEKSGGHDVDWSQLPGVDFSTFVCTLNSSALVMMGALADPTTGDKIKNLPAAKQTIDIIGMLEEKTRGNLTGEETNLLKNILHDLRMMFVSANGRQAGG